MTRLRSLLALALIAGVASIHPSSLDAQASFDDLLSTLAGKMAALSA